MSCIFNTQECNSSLWASLPATPTEKPKNKIRKGVTIIYPEFIDSAKTIEDKYWIRLLTSCSKNQFPKGFSYEECKLKYKDILYDLDISNPEFFGLSAINIFRTIGNISSKTDNLNKLQKSRDILDKKAKDEYTSWGVISKTKNKRTQMFEEYINSKFVDCSTKIRNIIFTQINVLYDRGDLLKEDIVYSNGHITNIERLYLDDENRVRIKESKKKKATKKEDTSYSIEEYLRGSFPDYHQIWEKSLKKTLD